ncbi:hypothetical protein JTB14_006336 [Gonioctena quinquepunctata]|nr:hypothetical protein JTB14_006336 [Gonioctena quinquepunctata]
MRRYKHFIDVLLYSSLVKLSMGECELSGTNFSCDGEDVKTIIYEYNSKNTGNIGITNIEIVNSSSSVLGSFLGFLENETREKVKVMKINDCELDEIASDVFSQFEALEVLDLSGNRISNLEFLTTSPKSLKEIYLGHNKITEITDSFSEMENLQIIDMSYSTIETIDFIVFKNNPHLELVNVSHNNIQSSESKEYLKNIKCVDLSYNNLAKYDNIPSYCLDLSYTNMTGYRWYNIAEKNKTVYIEKFFYSGNDHLQLSATNIKNETLPIEIKYLNISGFTGSVSSDLLLDKVKVRKELIMKDSVIPSLEKSVYDFKILFYDEGTNTTFDLSNCSITDISILYFANYILGRLNLCHNKFKTLEDNVFKDAYIIQLDLCNSSIEAIADNAFQGLHTVLLNLSMNNIEKIGF